MFKDHKPPYFVLATVLNGRGVLRENTKTRKTKPLPIIPEIEECFKYRELSQFVFSDRGIPYYKSKMNHIWKKASLEANKKYGTPITPLYRAFRHSFACQRLNEGFSLEAIQRVMGHTDMKTTLKYAKYQTQNLSDVMRGKNKQVALRSQIKN